MSDSFSDFAGFRGRLGAHRTRFKMGKAGTAAMRRAALRKAAEAVGVRRERELTDPRYAAANTTTLGSALERLLTDREQRGRAKGTIEPGTGLGAAMASELIRAAGGSIDVSSVVGRGSVFRFRLPLHPLECGQSDVSPPSRGLRDGGVACSRIDLCAAGEDDRQAEPLHILVAEDEPAMRAALCRMLEQAGHRVRAFADGEGASACLASGGIDAAIIDGHLPGLSGAEVIARVRARAVEPGVVRTRLIMLTADATAASRTLAAAAGADVWLEKPVDAARVMEALPTRRDRVAAGSQAVAIASDATLTALARRSIAESFQALHAALDAGDAAAIRAWLHRLKGTARLMGHTAADQAITRFERQGEMPSSQDLAALEHLIGL
jgi:DNA-binding response OmpR family regulator